MTPIVVTNSSPAGRISRVKAPPPATPATPFFQDSFENGQLNPYGGFTWQAMGGRKQIVANAASPSGYSLAIRCGPNAPDADGNQSEIEQSYTFGRDLSEFWAEWNWTIPSNFTHRKRAGKADNNKLVAWYFNTYGAADPERAQMFVLEFWPIATNGTSLPQSYLRVMQRIDYGDPTALVSDIPDPALFAFIGDRSGVTGPMLVGSRNRLQVYWKASSAQGVNDGVIKMWGNNVLFVDRSGLALYPPPWSTLNGQRPVLKQCKFFGSSNSGYTDETTFMFDSFKFYDTNPGW
jgi:hypothetical protein